MFGEISLRKYSENMEHFPVKLRTVPFVRISQVGGVIEQAKSPTEKGDMLVRMGEGDILLAAWPGQWSQDVFLMDDIEVLKVAFAKEVEKAEDRYNITRVKA